MRDIPFKGLYRALIPSFPTKNQGAIALNKKNHVRPQSFLKLQNLEQLETIGTAPKSEKCWEKGLGFRVIPRSRHLLWIKNTPPVRRFYILTPAAGRWRQWRRAGVRSSSFLRQGPGFAIPTPHIQALETKVEDAPRMKCFIIFL